MSNIYKGNYYYGAKNASDKRVIDTNELVAARLETLAEILKQKQGGGSMSGEGFVQGLQAEDVSALLADNGDEGSAVIKAEPDTSAILQQAKSEAEALVANAKQQADVIMAEAMEQAANSKKNVLEEARMNGYREGINRANKEVEALKAELAQQKKAMEAEYEAKYEAMESDLVDVITDIYEHIFHVDLSSYREILVHLISTTIRKVEGSRSFIIHVSKEDYPFVSMQKKQLVAGLAISSAVDIVEDLTQVKGECFVEADGGIFDCGLGTQLKELRKKLKVLSYEN
ncbi:MAG: hypothetical protein IJX63_02970 [Lachnospiraceae bacterium]|nr:hypothetical protein [Lachnospiraceae bacterium]